MALGKNLKKLREAKDWTQDELSARTNGRVSQGAIAALENRDSASSRFTADLAAALGVPVSTLIDGLPNVTAIHPEDPVPDDSIQIPEYRVHFSAGNGHQINYELIEESERATYRLSWFQKYGINPANVRRFKVIGDSMEPFLFANDSVLVNLAENDRTNLIDGKVYALRYGNELRLKRLYRRLNGTLTLRSDNPAYKDEEVAPELVEEHITIIGRVRDKSGAGGL
jgi:transcriptional regulator with XRE-family HTH domain